MRKRWIAVLLFLAILFFLPYGYELFVSDTGKILLTRAQHPLEEHVYGGLPGGDSVLVRNGFVLAYDPVRRVPSWVAYHIAPDYLNIPDRKGKYARFRADEAVQNPVDPDDYTNSGYHRGHLAPFFAMGGDRDRDGQYASDGDKEDAETVFQANRMSNIVPQFARFNGSGGLWYDLETWVREELVKGQGREAWVFAGCIFGPGAHRKIGPDEDIWVPPMFFKIVVLKGPSDDRPVVLAFLLPHQSVTHKQKGEQTFPYFLVSVDVIEAMTGLDFFRGLDAEDEIEAMDTWGNWLLLAERHP